MRTIRDNIQSISEKSERFSADASPRVKICSHTKVKFCSPKGNMISQRNTILSK